MNSLFKEAGYTEKTKFKVLVNYDDLRVGDMVTISHTSESIFYYFKTEDGRTGAMYLPNMGVNGSPEELEVYKEV